MQGRGLILFVLFIVLMFYLGIRIRKANSMLATALFAASGMLLLILLGAVTGLIGG